MAQGCSQKHQSNYDETFSPLVRFESVRTVLALAAQHGLKVNQMDVTTAFLNGELEEEVYMKQPPGFEVKNQAKSVPTETKHLWLTTISEMLEFCFGWHAEGNGFSADI